MRVLVCCLFIILNIYTNGKASLDSYAPINANNFEDGTKNSDSCYRPCKFNVQPKRCHYKFKIEPVVLEDGKPGITVNGVSPGPQIQACVNDVIVVEVENKIPDQDVSIHWHGIEQKGTPYMDGVPMVTQCPINYGGKYKYAFIASSPGTFFYHAHSVSHQSDGLYGSLIVNQPAQLEPLSVPYDYDRSRNNTLIIGARFSELMTGSLEDVSQLQPEKLLINGDNKNMKLFVSQGFGYRLRLINAIAIECPIVVSIDRHEITAIATDGRPVKPVRTRSVQLFPGERMDVVVRASKENGGYWVRVKGAGACASVNATAMLLYSGFNYTSMLDNYKNQVDGDTTSDYVPLTGQMMESFKDVPYISEPKRVYLGIDRTIVKEKENDYRYVSDAIPKKPFFPAYIALQEKGVVQINKKSFLYPNVPILLRPKDVVTDKICVIGSEELQSETQCVQVIKSLEGEALEIAMVNEEKGVVQINKKSFLYPNVPILLRPKDVVTDKICVIGSEELQSETQCVQVIKSLEGEAMEIAMVNEGFGSNDSYTFHIHGSGMQVIATGKHPDGKPLTKDKFLKLDRENKIVRNLQNAPVKDTISVPNKGFTIIRIRPDKGSWLLECRSCSLSSLPAAIIIQVPQTIPKAVLQALPKCGNYRPPDVLLN